MVNNLVSQSSSTADPNQEGGQTSTLPSIAEQALSFLRETEGVLNWSVLDLAHSLKISRRSAELVLIALQAEGYVQPGWGPDNWMTAQEGESVSGMKPLDS
jgi:hypothetical protein